jgi:hypothetical protein
VDIQDLANYAIAVAAHHIPDPRPAEAAGTVPDDGTPHYAISELRRITYWSLEKGPNGAALVAGLTGTPHDPALRAQAAQLLAVDLQQFSHLVPAVNAFVARAWAPPSLSVPVDPWSSDAMRTTPWPVGSPAPTLAPPEGLKIGGLQIGQRRLGWGLVAAILVGLLLLAGGGTTTIILLTRPSTTTPDAPARYHGSLEFGSIDIDQNPPTGGFGMDVMSTTGPSLLVASGASGVKYYDDTTPTRAQCHQAIAQFGISGDGPAGQTTVLDRVSPGMVFCVSTRNGVVASLKITATTDSTFTANVIIWQS